MPSDFTVFHAHLAEACRDRKKAPDPLCAAAVDLHFAGVRALDVYRLAKLADELDVSVDWLLGRSDMMELPKAKIPVNFKVFRRSEAQVCRRKTKPEAVGSTALIASP